MIERYETTFRDGAGFDSAAEKAATAAGKAASKATAEADRQKEVKVTLAEAEAQEGLVKDIKAAEAQEKVAEFQARERLVMANAALEAAEKEAQAKIRLAEGAQAEHAARPAQTVMLEVQVCRGGQKAGKLLAEALDSLAVQPDVRCLPRASPGRPRGAPSHAPARRGGSNCVLTLEPLCIEH